MVSHRRAQSEKYDEDLRNNPPILVWKTIPNTGGLRVAVYVYDPQNKPGPRSRPPCECNLYGGPRRRKGDHHNEGCGRRTA